MSGTNGQTHSQRTMETGRVHPQGKLVALAGLVMAALAFIGSPAALVVIALLALLLALS